MSEKIRCGKCKEDKDPEEFFKSNNPNHHTGRQGYCKECAKGYKKKYYEDHNQLFRLQWANMMADPEKYKKVREQQNRADRKWRAKKKKENG